MKHQHPPHWLPGRMASPSRSTHTRGRGRMTPTQGRAARFSAGDQYSSPVAQGGYCKGDASNKRATAGCWRDAGVDLQPLCARPATLERRPASTPGECARTYETATRSATWGGSAVRAAGTGLSVGEPEQGCYSYCCVWQPMNCAEAQRGWRSAVGSFCTWALPLARVDHARRR